MKTKIMSIMGYFICAAAILLMSECLAIGQDQSDIYVHVKLAINNRDVSNATVIAKSPYNTYTLNYQLTSVGWAYTKNVISSVSYTIYVDDVQVSYIYINGSGSSVGQVSVPVNGYADATYYK